ncbi:uncharacterized protein LOC136082326 [Hydra vulgaris]|uniref:Uncharacterized protein LOC136082326 n=1 Tax=Hydra vulgaris TaxID=6087 RepID=A0ABM4C6V1_HYDVU
MFIIYLCWFASVFALENFDNEFKDDYGNANWKNPFDGGLGNIRHNTDNEVLDQKLNVDAETPSNVARLQEKTNDNTVKPLECEAPKYCTSNISYFKHFLSKFASFVQPREGFGEYYITQVRISSSRYSRLQRLLDLENNEKELLDIMIESFEISDEGELKVHSIEPLKVFSDNINKCGAPEKCIFNTSYFIQFLINYTSLLKPCCHLNSEHFTAQVKLKKLLDSEYCEKELLDILNDFYEEYHLCITNQNSGISFRNFLWYCLLAFLFCSTVMFWYEKYFEKSKNKVSIIKPKINSFITEEVCKENDASSAENCKVNDASNVEYCKENDASNVENCKENDVSNVENCKENDASSVEKKRRENDAVEKDNMTEENKKINFSLSVEEESVYFNNITDKLTTDFCL